jgi:hypothetical protein
MTSILAYILAMVITLIPGNAAPDHSEFMERIWGGQECLCSKEECEWCGMTELAPVMSDDEIEWGGYYFDALDEYMEEFTALFNSYETKRASNGAMMIRTGNAGSFKFARKG